MNSRPQFIERLVDWGRLVMPTIASLRPVGSEARQDQLEALQQGIDAVRPVFSQFESELTDVQKAKLGRVVNVSTEITSVVH